MDFLDPAKRRKHAIRLLVGYVLVAIVILLGTLVLLYQAYGFGLKKGEVIQNGLIFVSSRPSPASIYLKDKLEGTTNSRLILQTGTYTMRLTRAGYHDWQRALTVEGSGVEHIDYPFLVPTKLTTSDVATYATAPAVTTQSPDRRWLLVQQPGQLGTFDVYDTKDPKKIVSSVQHISMPPTLITASHGAQSLEVVEWSNDNIHVLLKHMFDGKFEYLSLNRQDPTQSVNVSQSLQLSQTVTLTLQNKKYDRYFLFDTVKHTLSIATTKLPTPEPFLDNVLQFKTYGDDIVLFATDKNMVKGQTAIRLYQDKKLYTIRTVPTDTRYLLDIAQYSGAWYVAAGASSENRVYIFRDPVAALTETPSLRLIPMSVLKVLHPTYVAFSANTQFIMAESGTQFSVYDAETDRNYTYVIDHAIDAPQPHATWMDGDRLTYISQGSVVMFDYDGTNIQTLTTGDSAYAPYFDTGYKYLYALAPPHSTKGKALTQAEAAQRRLVSTPLLVPKDL